MTGAEADTAEEMDRWIAEEVAAAQLRSLEEEAEDEEGEALPGGEVNTFVSEPCKAEGRGVWAPFIAGVTVFLHHS